MMSLFPAGRLADATAILVIFSPLIVLSLRAAVDPAPAIALLNRVVSELDQFNPPWMQRGRSGQQVVPDTPGNRAFMRLLSASVTAAAFYKLAEQLSLMVR